MLNGLKLLPLCLLMTGCAALAPLSSLISTPHAGGAPLQVHEETRVDLAQDNFELVKTNVFGRSKGFSLLGFITMCPATLTKAMNRMYAAAQMQPGESQTLAHLVIEQSSSYWILFGIPEVNVRADIVQFRPGVKPTEKAKTGREAPKPPG